MKKKMRQLPMLAIVLASLLLALALPCAAAPAESCSLELTFAPKDLPAGGVTFRVYRVAQVNTNNATFTPVAPYSSYNVLGSTADWLDRAATLESYVLRDKLPATAQAVTDEDGVASFTGLQSGLYLILGERYQREGFFYTPVSCFLSLPNSYDRGLTWVSQVSARMKFSETPDTSGQTLQRHALKVWHDEGHEDQRPQKVTVDLLRDGEVFDTVDLSAGNNWRCDWTDLDGASEWRLVEREVENYIPVVTQEGITFLVTNTYKAKPIPPTPTPTPGGGGGDDGPDPTPTPTPTPTATSTPAPSGSPAPSPTPPASTNTPNREDPDPGEEDLGDEEIPLSDLVNDPGDGEPDPGEDLGDNEIPLTRLPQTGQLWWPVPLLAVLGLFLILSGLIRRRRGELWDGEE